jgi:hypothetical protein
MFIPRHPAFKGIDERVAKAAEVRDLRLSKPTFLCPSEYGAVGAGA